MGRSKVISIPSTSSHCRTSCNMKKLLLFVFLGLVALSLSENLGQEQGNNVEEALDESELENIEVTSEDESLDVSRSKRDADPKKKRKNKGKKSQKDKNKPRNGKKKNRKNRRKSGKKTAKKGRKKANRKSKGRKRSNKKKGGKKSRKAGKRKNKAVKQRKTKRKQNKRGKKIRKVVPSSGDQRGACSRAVNSTCLETAVKLLKIVQQRVTNFLQQQKRMSKFNGTGAKKSAKKGLFGPIASKVIDIGGGNASDLSCSGNKTNPGATKLKSIISDLQKCEKQIMVACDTSAYPHPNMTEVMECKTNMETMKTSVEACAKKTGDEACTCWMDADLMAVAEKVKNCDISKENKKVTAAHKECTGNFSACKKIEDSAVTYIFACSQSADALKVKAAQTKKNVNALEAAKTKTGTLAGNSTGRNTVIRKRATSVSTCGDFVSLSAKLLTAADAAPTSSTVETMAKILSAVSDALSCSTSEKSTLTVQVTTYTQTISKVTATYEGLKSSVEDASGTTSDAEIVAAGEAAGTTDATKNTAAKRNRLVRKILNNLN